MEPTLCSFHQHLFHQHFYHNGMRSWTLFTSTLLIILLSSLSLKTNAQECNNAMGCFPPTGNLALGRTINVSSTCTTGSEFCLFLSPGPDCDLCSSESTHSSTNLNDDSRSTIWISQIGSGSDTVTLQMDFEAPLLFEDMTIVFHSVRPRTLILERSSDFGQSWQVYRYYSASCRSLNMSDTFILDSTVLSSTDPVCTSVQSDLFPFMDGEVTFSTLQHLPPGTNASVALAYQTVTNLRVQLVDRFEEVEISGTSYQYYSISEWIVNGHCLCNGHANMCVPGPGEEMATNKVYTGCACRHNTVGDNCEQCEAGFNNVPWQPGTQTEANICEECMCNGHATECEYIPSQSSAVCLTCSDNTAGDQCEQCLPTFYQDPVLMLNDPNICRSCECDPTGVSDAGLCDANGQCNCKANVVSTMCDQCEDGYWNLTQDNPNGCQVCDCNPFGTMPSADNNLPVCNKTTGECFCRDNVQSIRCNRCLPGYFNLGAGCLPCDCNVGGSVSQVCEQDTAVMQCPCKPNIGTSTCSSPLPGYYFRLLDDIIFEAEETLLPGDPTLVFPVVGTTSPFTGQGFVRVSGGTDLDFTLMVPEDSQYEIILRYEATTEVENIVLSLFSVDPVSRTLECLMTNQQVNVSQLYNISLSSERRHIVVDSVCLISGVQYGLRIRANSPAAEWLLDSVLLLPDFQSTSAFYDSQTTQFQQDFIEPCLPRQSSDDPLDLVCREISFTLSTEFYSQAVLPCECDLLAIGSGDSPSSTCDFAGGQCEQCQPGVTGRLCDTCLNGWFNFSDGQCQDCGCDVEGSVSAVCDMQSGLCECHPGVGGRTCDQCLPGFFNLTSEGCSECQCSEYATSSECTAAGQCDCPYGVVGLKCDQCDAGFYNISADGCLDCLCDPLGSTSNQCDVVSGQCSCSQGSVGQDCSRCPGGFFATDGLVRERCVRCVCSGRTEVCTVDENTFALGAIQSNFSDMCALSPTACNDGWQLLTASGQNAAPYGPSDSSGLGYILLVNDFPMVYAPERYLGNRQASYGLNFTIMVQISNTGAINNGTTIARMVGSNFNEALIGIFPFPQVVANGFGVERHLTYSIPFLEEFWRVGSSTGRNPTFMELLHVLTNVTEFSYTAQYTEDLIEFIHIVSIDFQTALPIAEAVNSSLASNSTSEITVIISPFPAENCNCPEAYQGSSCTDCARGYARSSDNVLEPCNRCECNNQTLDCNPSTGECLNCQGNTEGFNCERCIAGYYGDPTRGIPCLPCECPLPGNSFSPTCFLDSDGLQTCDNCDEGYTGRNCETCMDGYFGSPMLGRCTTCECNGNVDPALGPVCNTTTGQCLNCLNNTIGFECELCAAGFYGDPQYNIPCEMCPCNPEGTVGDCDRLTGSCECQANVIGTLCDECADTFWGLSQGLGCIPCDCCTGNGSISEICNKDTGDCDCLPNVGSAIDNRCCMCAPGYFNLLPDVGCESCNCSSLAVSESCDQASGRCECLDGAIGLKCDDCAFGYTGRVPDCERCHECFFQWHDVIGNLSVIVNGLQSQITSLISSYYNNHTANSVQTEITLLLDQLNLANQTLNEINIQETDIDNLNQVLAYINSSILAYGMRVRSIQNTLRQAQVMLNESFAFDGSFNMTLVNDIQRELLLHNVTIATHAANANMSLTLLFQAQENARQLWTDLSALNSSIQDILLDLSLQENEVDSLVISLEDYQTTYDSLRGNLSLLDTHTNNLNSQLSSLSESVFNASQDISTVNGSLLDLNDEVRRRQAEADIALGLATQINASVASAKIAAQSALDMVNTLQEYTGNAVNSANTTFNSVLDTLRGVGDDINNLSDVKELVQSVLDTMLPSLEYAAVLASQIENYTLPQDVVDEILMNATAGRNAAQQALSIIQNASDAVGRAQNLVTELQEDIESIRTTLDNIVQVLPTLQGSITDRQEDINEINDIASEVNSTVREVETSVEDTMDMIESSENLGMDNQMRSADLLNESRNLETQIQQHQNDINSALNDYDLLRNEINMTEEHAESVLNRAEGLNIIATNLNTTANTISLQQLLDLASEYNREVVEVQDLSRRIAQSQQEIQQLRMSLTNASQRLQQCYRTP